MMFKTNLLKTTLVVAVGFLFQNANAQTVISYGKKNVQAAEFLKAFNKTKSDPKQSRYEAMKEYADLYANYKLKVDAGNALGYDTLPQIKFDIANFSNQLAESYVGSPVLIKKLEDEALVRANQDVKVYHFFIPVAPNAVAADTLTAFNNIKKWKQDVASGKKDFADQAQKYSGKQGSLGFITVFSVPYEYENIIYGLKNGTVSEPIRAANGWHFFKRIEDRPAAGTWQVAQILFAVEPGIIDNLSAKKTADSVYHLLKNGMSFDEAVLKFSNDRSSNNTRGLMPVFGTGKFSESFEEPVFALKKDGDITEPFETSLGYHIVKRINVEPINTLNNELNSAYKIKQQLQNEQRTKDVKELFGAQLVSTTKFKRVPAFTDAILFAAADQIKNDKSIDIEKVPIANKVIANYPKEKLYGKDWLHYIKYYPNSSLSNKQLWNQFINQQSINYYKQHLSDYNKDFKEQVDEFRDGNVLFEIMERKVWGKGSDNEAALKAIYNKNPSKFIWAKSADAIILNGANEVAMQNAIKQLQAGKSWNEIMSESENTIQADSSRYELEQMILPENFVATDGSSTPIIKSADGTVSYIHFLKVYPAGMQRNFNDSKAMLVNEYQDNLDRDWIKELRAKNKVVINDAAIKQLAR